MANPVVHFELWSEDPDRAATFYREAFDWNIRNIPEMNYHLVDKARDDGIGGGIMKPQEGPWPAAMTFYIDVDDLATARDRIIAAGGEMVVEEMEIPGVGLMALFKDPDDRVIGLWKQVAEG